MIAVIFEVEPADGQEGAYLDIAADLRPLLNGIEGFISVERFRSLINPGKVLSLSFFESEDAVIRWRNMPEHRRAQSAGRAGVFAGYRLRIAQVIRDYSMQERAEAPVDSKSVLAG